MPRLGVALIFALLAILSGCVVTRGRDVKTYLLEGLVADPPPWALFHLGVWGLNTLDTLRDALTPPHIRVAQISIDHIRPQVLYALAALDIPEALSRGPLSAADLAPLVGVPDAEKLDRVLRAAVALRLLAPGSGHRGPARRLQGAAATYRNTPMSAVLRDSEPHSMRSVMRMTMEQCFAPYSHFVAGLRQDEVPFLLHSGGRDIWEHLAGEPAQEALFSAAMTEHDRSGMNAVVADFAWGNYDRIIDVGGAHGSALAALLSSNPAARGVLFDQPLVISRAEEIWNETRAELLPRIKFVGGSFFEPATIPRAEAGARTVFLLRTVLHDWSDAKSVEILSNVRTAMGAVPGSALAIVEGLPNAPGSEQIAERIMMDLHMLVMTDGKERSRDEWEPLLARTGFRLQSVHPTRGYFKVLLASPTA